MTHPFPNCIESVTCDWLTRVLRQQGSLQSGTVSTFTTEAIDEGYTSTVYRLLPEYDDRDTTAPGSLIVKFHSTSQSIRQTFEKFDIYRKEVEFYRFAEANEQLPVPACYAAEYDDASTDFVLLLEDMSAARLGSSGLDPLTDIRAALPQLAKIHAQYWGSSKLAEYSWVTKPCEQPTSGLHRSEWESCLPAIKSGYRQHWSETTWDLCEQILQHWDDIMLCMNRDTHTLVHTDAHLGQMFFPSEQLPRFALFDWQNPCKALASEDVTHLIVNELSPEERREHEADLMELYYQSLCRETVVDLSLERLWFQCRLSLIWFILMHFRIVTEPDLLQTLKDEAEAEGDPWQEWVFDHIEPAISDWKLQAAVDQAIAEARLLKS